MKLASLDDVYLHQLKDLASVERQLSAALVKLTAAASNLELKKIFTEHKDETDHHLELVEGLYKALKGKSSTRYKCEGIAGIIKEAEPMLSATGDESAKDAALIGAAQRSEHYEIAGYGTAVALAEQLSRSEDAATLRQILEQEKEADRTLSALATGSVNPQGAAAPSEGESAGDAEDGDSDEQQEQGQGQLAMWGGQSGSSSGTHYAEQGGQQRSGGYGQRQAGQSNRQGAGQGGGQWPGSGQQQWQGGSQQPRQQGDAGSAWQFGNQAQTNKGNHTMGRDEYEDRGYASRSGSRGSSGRGGYDQDDRGGGSSRGGGYEGRSEGGRRSSEMQERDEYGQFAGYGGGSGGSSSRGGSGGGGGRGGYDDDNRGGSFRGGYSPRGGGYSRSYTGDDEGGYSSRSDARGSSSRGGGYDDDDDNRFGGYEGRFEGGRHSSQMQHRDEYGQFAGYGGGSSSRGGNGGGGGRGGYDDDDRGGSSRSGSRGSSSRSSSYDDDDEGGSSRGGGGGSRGGSRGGRADEYVDSAGRHYSRESWERAQEGRSLGGQHSHGGRR